METPWRKSCCHLTSMFESKYRQMTRSNLKGNSSYSTSSLGASEECPTDKCYSSNLPPPERKKNKNKIKIKKKERKKKKRKKEPRNSKNHEKAKEVVQTPCLRHAKIYDGILLDCAKTSNNSKHESEACLKKDSEVCSSGAPLPFNSMKS